MTTSSSFSFPICLCQSGDYSQVINSKNFQREQPSPKISPPQHFPVKSNVFQRAVTAFHSLVLIPFHSESLCLSWILTQSWSVRDRNASENKKCLCFSLSVFNLLVLLPVFLQAGSADVLLLWKDFVSFSWSLLALISIGLVKSWWTMILILFNQS